MPERSGSQLRASTHSLFGGLANLNKIKKGKLGVFMPLFVKDLMHNNIEISGFSIICLYFSLYK
jgi:hypothetical protein